MLTDSRLIQIRNARSQVRMLHFRRVAARLAARSGIRGLHQLRQAYRQRFMVPQR